MALSKFQFHFKVELEDISLGWRGTTAEGLINAISLWKGLRRLRLVLNICQSEAIAEDVLLILLRHLAQLIASGFNTFR